MQSGAKAATSAEWWAAPTSAENRTPIETFVFFDFETNDKFHDHASDPFNKRWTAGDQRRKPENRFHALFKQGEPGPYITEFCFMTVPRALLERGMRKMASRHALSTAANVSNGADASCALQMADANNCIKTRVAANVHTRQINPMLSAEEWRAYEVEMTKYRYNPNKNPFHLDKHELLTKHTFALEWRAGLRDFLANAPKPACLVAYNGINFDFRVLMRELQRDERLFDSHPIPERVYFLDAYMAFLDIEKSYHDSVEAAVNAMDWRIVTNLVLNVSKHEDRRPPATGDICDYDDDNDDDDDYGNAASVAKSATAQADAPALAEAPKSAVKVEEMELEMVASSVTRTAAPHSGRDNADHSNTVKNSHSSVKNSHSTDQNSHSTVENSHNTLSNSYSTSGKGPSTSAKRNLNSIYTLSIQKQQQFHPQQQQQKQQTSKTTASVGTTKSGLAAVSGNCSAMVVSVSEQSTVDAAWALKRPLTIVGATPPKRQMHMVERQISQSEPPRGSSPISLLRAYEMAHPLRFLSCGGWSPAKKRRMRAEFFQRTNNGDWRFNPGNYFFGQGNFTLSSVYKQVIRAEFDAHRAQDDSEALAQLCMAYGDDFLRYADAQRFLFPAGAYGARQSDQIAASECCSDKDHATRAPIIPIQIEDEKTNASNIN